jgi:mannose-6-phosphate isomerase-like protein (cupin superfamily)
MDEAFYVLEGRGILTLNDARHPFDKGGTMFIPKSAWDQPVSALAVSYVLPILLPPLALYLIRLRA